MILSRLLFPLLMVLLGVTSCDGQSKDRPRGAGGKAVEKSGQAKLIRTQGTSQYAGICCGLQDRDRNLWFGTGGEGVYRYDGKSFTQFVKEDGLCNNYVYCMLEDTAGNIWFGTAYGVCRYDGKQFSSVPIVVPRANSFQPYTLPLGQFTVNQYGAPAMENIVWSIMQDKKGNFWFGTTTGVYCYNGAYFTNFPHNTVANKDSLHLKMISYMLEDGDGNTWFCSGMLPGNEGICRFDGKALTQYKPNGENWIRKVIAAKDSALYFATRHNGVLRYDGKGFSNMTAKAGIDNGSVNTLLEDRSGSIWMGTELGSGQRGEDGGVWRWNLSGASDKRSFTRFTTKDGLVHNGVSCIVEDKAGNLWFGSRDMGLCRFDGKGFTRFSE